jgi:hypothetical protein
MGLTTAQNLVSGFRESTIEGVEKSVILEKALNILEPRRDHLISQFARIGLLARQLKTQEIIQLFYASYNPEATDGQQITDSRSYTTPLVQAQIRGVLMNDQPSSAMPAPAVTPEPMPAAAPTMPAPAAMPSAPTPMSPTPATMSAPTPMSAAPMTTPTPMTPPTPPAMSMPSPAPLTPMAAPTPTPMTPPSGGMPSISESPTTVSPAAPASAPSAMTIEAPTPTMATPSMPPVTPPMSSSAPSATTPPVHATEAQAVINSTLQELTTAPVVEDEPPAPDLARVEPVIPPPKPDQAPSN